jgi:hypothetical protein
MATRQCSIPAMLPHLIDRSEFADMSDEQLLALEESLYDSDVEGFDVWFLRDQVLWEMNYRGLCK